MIELARDAVGLFLGLWLAAVVAFVLFTPLLALYLGGRALKRRRAERVYREHYGTASSRPWSWWWGVG